MIAYCLFIILICWGFLSCFYFLKEQAEVISQEFQEFQKSRTLHFFMEGKHQYVFWAFGIFLSISVPFVYEFPRWIDSLLGKEMYLLKNYESKKGSFTIERLNWYGNFQKIRNPFCVELIYPGDYDFTLFNIKWNHDFIVPIREIKIFDLLSKKSQIVSVSFCGTSFQDFILATYNASEEIRPNIVAVEKNFIESISGALRDSEEDLDVDNVRAICDDWLYRNNVPARTVVISVSANSFTNKTFDISE